MPDNVQIENEEIIHFLNARQLHYSGSREIENIICEYTKAISINPAFVEAYNNLAIFLFPYQTGNVFTGFDLAISDDAKKCLEELGIDFSSQEMQAETILKSSLEIRPGWTLPRYNIIVFHWSVGSSEYWRSEIEDLIDTDPTLPGPYLMLGGMAFQNKEYEDSKEWFSKALVLLPNSSEILFNLGQIELLMNNNGNANEIFLEILDSNPENAEAMLGLANISYREGDIDQSVMFLEALLEQHPLTDETFFTSPEYDAELFLAALQYEIGDVDKSIMLLESSTYKENDFVYYLLALLHQKKGLQIQADNYYSFIDPPRRDGWSAFYTNPTSEIIWQQLIWECGEIIESWSNCLHNNTDEQIVFIFQRFILELSRRSFFKVPNPNGTG